MKATRSGLGPSNTGLYAHSGHATVWNSFTPWMNANGYWPPHTTLELSVYSPYSLMRKIFLFICPSGSLFDEAKRWFEAATVICRFVPGGKERAEKVRALIDCIDTVCILYAPFRLCYLDFRVIYAITCSISIEVLSK